MRIMWFEWALTTAVFSSIVYVLSKHLVDKISTLVTTWTLFALSLPILAVLVFRKGVPELNQLFWVGVVVSGVGFAVVKSFTLLAFKKSKVSKIMPLNVVSMVSAYLTSLLMLREVIGVKELFGLSLIVVGIYWINIEKSKESWLAPIKELKRHKASLMYIVSISFAGVFTAFDKLAIMNTQPRFPEMVLFMENGVATVALGLLLFKQRRWEWLEDIKVNWKGLVFLSWLYLVNILAAFHGFSSGPVALVLGIKKLQILFAMLWAWLFLGDKPKKEQLGGALIMIVGAILLKV